MMSKRLLTRAVINNITSLRNFIYYLIPLLIISQSPFFWRFQIYRSFIKYCTIGLLCLYLYQIYKNKKNLSFLMWLIILYNLFVTIVSKSRGYEESLFVFMLGVLTCLIIEMVIIKNDERNFVNGARVFFSLLIYINLVLIIIYPEGLYYEDPYYNNWLLGYKNFQSCIIFPGMLFAFLDSYYSHKRIISTNSLFVILASGVTFAIIWPASSVAAFFIFILGLIFFSRKQMPPFINLWNVFLISAIFFILIIVFNIQEHFAWLIEDVLKRDLSFTGRTNIIWNSSIKSFLSSPFIGFGNPDSKYARLIIFGINAHAHNDILDVLVRSGIVGLCIYIGMILCVNKRLLNYRHFIVARVMLITIASVFVLGIVGVNYSRPTFFPMLMMAYHIENFCSVPYREMIVKQEKQKKSRIFPVSNIKKTNLFIQP